MSFESIGSRQERESVLKQRYPANKRKRWDRESQTTILRAIERMQQEKRDRIESLMESNTKRQLAEMYDDMTSDHPVFKFFTRVHPNSAEDSTCKCSFCKYTGKSNRKRFIAHILHECLGAEGKIREEFAKIIYQYDAENGYSTNKSVSKNETLHTPSTSKQSSSAGRRRSVDDGNDSERVDRDLIRQNLVAQTRLREKKADHYDLLNRSFHGSVGHGSVGQGSVGHGSVGHGSVGHDSSESD